MSRYIDLSPVSNNSLSRSGAENNTSMIIAMNKLKEVEDRIYEARSRLNILYKKHSKEEYQKMHQTKLEGFRTHIRGFASNNKSIKNQYYTKRSAQIDTSHEVNMQRRAEHKEKIFQMKEMIQTQNKWIYENIRKQRIMNEERIRREKSKEQDGKKKRRNEMFEDEKRRTSFMKQFLHNKHLTAKLSKQQETSSIHSKILEREKFLQSLERQQIQMSVNPESLSGSRERSEKGSKGESRRVFRISNKKSQTALIS